MHRLLPVLIHDAYANHSRVFTVSLAVQKLIPSSLKFLNPTDAMEFTSKLRVSTLWALAVLFLNPISASAEYEAHPQIVNLSSRGRVGTGDDVLIAGFVVEGPGTQRVLVRAAGPALAGLGVSGTLTQPRLQLFSGQSVLMENEQWDGGDNAAEIETEIARSGAIPFAAGSTDAAVIADLAPGAYTAVVSGVGNTEGVALVEIYKLIHSTAKVMTPTNLAAIDEIVEAALTNYEIPGILLGIKFYGEAPWTKAWGVRDMATQEAMGPDDHFRIGSASKTFVGMAALRLIEQDKLEFETTIADILPADVLDNYQRDKITVRMLLRHTSGINNYTNDIADWFFPYILDRTRVWTDEELVELVNSKYSDAEMGMVFTPGAGWFYSNTNTVLLAMIIEKITGKNIQTVLNDEFIVPVGLTKTVYPSAGDSTLPEPYAHGYMNWANFTGESSLPSDLEDVSVYDPSGVGPAGPIISTVGDLTIWMETMAKNDEVSGDFRRGHMDWNFYTSFAGGEPGAAVGSYGFNIAHEPDPNNNANYWIVGHRGQISGYDTAMMYLPEQNVSLVLVCNRSLKFGTGLPTNALTAALNDIIGKLYPEMIAESQLSSTGTRKMAADQAEPLRRMPLAEY